MAFLKLFLPVILLMFLNSVSQCCGLCNKYSQSSNYFLDTNVKITKVIEKLIEIFPGEIVKIEKKFKKNSPFWNVEMISGQGSSLEFEISSDENKIFSIEANEGPYEYEIIPDESIAPFSTAKKTAEEHTSQKILRWNFKYIKDKPEYSFWLFTKSGKAQLKIDAVSGEIIMKKNNSKTNRKNKPD
jgi:uncharacterized membrane protein YkoI